MKSLPMLVQLWVSQSFVIFSDGILGYFGISDTGLTSEHVCDWSQPPCYTHIIILHIFTYKYIMYKNIF